VPSADKDIGLLLRQAMDKVAFLPFGLLVDKWRWGVFDGSIPSTGYEKGWTDLRQQYQGIVPPVERTEADFDPAGPTMAGILALAQRHRVPVLLHVEWTRLRELSALLERFPDVAVIWAHGGYTPLFVARRMLERHPNLTYELSARTWPSHPRSPDYTILRDGRAVWPEWLALIEAMPERFVVGTDASHRSAESEAMKHASVQAFLRQLSPATRERVARANLLKLVQPLR